MIALFISFVCDYCDGLTNDGSDDDRGYVVWRARPMPAQEYVFPTREHAQRWRDVQGLAHCEIREVRTMSKFRWRKSTGSITGLEMADHLFEIYPNRRHPAGLHRAFLSDSR
jgi:hypothetical protein